MKLNKSAREMLDRYMLGVRRALTGKDREDIAREIESFLLDSLEERYPDKGELSASQVEDVLAEMGSPRKLAGQFTPQRCLIGPRLYPAYIMVMRIVVPVVVGAILLSFVIGTIAGTYSDAGFPVWEFLGGVWNGAFSAAAFVTLIFAAIDRASECADIEELKELEDFNLDDLPELSEKEKEPTVVGSSFEVVMGVLGLAFFTYIYNTGGTVPLFGDPGGAGSLRIFTPNFLRFVPVMMAITGMEVARSATLLVQGRNSSLTEWWQVSTHVANFILSVFLLGAFPLISLEGLGDASFAAGWNITRIASAANTGLRVILILSLVGSAVDVIQRVYRELKNPAG